MSIFQKRHYEFMAGVFYVNKPLRPLELDAEDYPEGRYELTRYNQWDKMVRRFASRLSSDNERFSQAWFIRACKTGDMRRQR